MFEGMPDPQRPEGPVCEAEKRHVHPVALDPACPSQLHISVAQRDRCQVAIAGLPEFQTGAALPRSQVENVRVLVGDEFDETGDGRVDQL